MASFRKNKTNACIFFLRKQLDHNGEFVLFFKLWSNFKPRLVLLDDRHQVLHG